MDSGEERRSLPVNSATKSASPIPTGAMKLPVCFSAASMKMVKTRDMVKSISMITPCAIDVVALSSVLTFRPPVNSPLTIAAAAMAATICVTKRSAARTMSMAPIRYIPTVTAGSVMIESDIYSLKSQGK